VKLVWSAYIFALIGLLFLGLSIPLILKQIPPNRFYGFRTPKTLSDPQIWYRANTFAGWALAIASVVIILAEVFLGLYGRALSPSRFELLALLAFILPPVLALIASLIYLKAL